MSRPIVGVTANLCPVDKEGKNIHSSVSSKFGEYQNRWWIAYDYSCW